MGAERLGGGGVWVVGTILPKYYVTAEYYVAIRFGHGNCVPIGIRRPNMRYRLHLILCLFVIGAIVPEESFAETTVGNGKENPSQPDAMVEGPGKDQGDVPN